MTHLKLRLGLVEHIESGKLYGCPLNIFTYILLKQQQSKLGGIVHLNSPIIANMLRIALRRAKDGLYELRKKKYIYYADTRGSKGAYPIFIDKCELFFNDHSTRKWITYLTDIWDANEQFIGEDIFFARLKVRKLHQIMHLSGGLSAVLSGGLSEAQRGLLSDFRRDFNSDFEKMNQVIDKYMSFPIIRTLVTDFDMDFEGDFKETLKCLPYIDRDVNVDLKNQEASPDSFKDIENLRFKLAANIIRLESIVKTHPDSNFNIKTFVGRAVQDKIPIEIIINILSVMIERHKTIVNFWGYGVQIAEKEAPNFFGAQSLRKHMDYKKEELSHISDIGPGRITE